MSRPLIGITCGTSALDTKAPNPQDRLNCAYSRAVLQAGGVPVILPNLDDAAAIETWLNRLDGLLLSGGYDLDPCLFGEPTLNDTVEIDGPRDAAELPLIHLALERPLPLFAICRGIQSLNVALGGTLYQDLPAQLTTAVCHRQEAPRSVCTHAVRVTPGSRLAEIVGSPTLEVNSFHHQAVKDLAPGLEAVGHAEDGVIEALERPGPRFLLAVQFHPEEMVGDSVAARKLFSAFVAECQNG